MVAPDPTEREGAADRPDDAAATEAAAEESPRELLVLRLGGARFGLWIDDVLEVLRPPPISRLPLPHPEVAGMTSVRGELIPVLDLGARLLGEPAARPGRLLLVRDERSDSSVGLLVDGADTLYRVMEEEVREPEADTGLAPELVEGVVTGDDGIVTILRRGPTAAPPADSNEVARS
jgi:chemotaxis signal transduction protein